MDAAAVMSRPPVRVSVIITNYNYGRFIAQCLTSVLEQDVADTEILVVDDGSTDDSLAVIATFADPRIRTITQANAGAAAAMNRGFEESRAPYVMFLDADDWLLPGSLREHVRQLSQPGVVRSQGCMIVMRDGTPTGETLPAVRPPDGDLSARAARRGPGIVVSAPTSGNAWARDFLRDVLPMPAQIRGIGTEVFMMDAAPLAGIVATSDLPIAAYRLHGNSMSDAKSTLLSPGALNLVAAGFDVRYAQLASYARKRGIAVDANRWLARNWRVLTIHDFLAREPGSDRARPPLATHLASAGYVSGGVHRKLFVAALIVAFRLLPLARAMRLAARYIVPKYM
jgi:glycosyltransferase involved in cell wall biosynthesis